MKAKLFMGAAAGAIAATMAFAQSSTDNLVAQLQEQGFTRIEVKRGPTQLKVEAIRGTTKRELVYDLATGELLKAEEERVRPGEDTSPGVEFDSRDRDFVGSDRNDDEDDDEDDDGENDDDEHDDDEDDEDDDRGGHGSDDDEDDDEDDRDDDEDDDDDDRSGSNSGRG